MMEIEKICDFPVRGCPLLNGFIAGLVMIGLAVLVEIVVQY